MLLDSLSPGEPDLADFRGQLRHRRHGDAGSCRCTREPAAPRPAIGHSHLRQPAFLAIAAAGSLIQASHAVYYGFATLDWSAKGFGGATIGVLWALGVVGRDRAVRVCRTPAGGGRADNADRDRRGRRRWCAGPR